MQSGPVRTVGRTSTSVTIGWILILLSGLSVVVYGLAFMAQNLFGLAELGLDLADIGLTPQQVNALPPRLVAYITHVQLALGGFIAAVGVATVFFAFGIREREKSSWWGAVAISVTWVLLTTSPHFILGFTDFSHLWVVYGYIVAFAIGAYLSRPGAR